MSLDPSTGTVIFICNRCKADKIGSPYDVRIGGEIFHTTNTSHQYSNILRYLPEDKTVTKVRKICPNCKAPFLCQARIGEQETIAYRCSCGYSV